MFNYFTCVTLFQERLLKTALGKTALSEGPLYKHLCESHVWTEEE